MLENILRGLLIGLLLAIVALGDLAWFAMAKDTHSWGMFAFAMCQLCSLPRAVRYVWNL